MSHLGPLEERIGWRFRDSDLLQLAITHPSVAHEHATTTQHNQRLEFLGDAVLQLVLTHALYERFGEFGEGPLTKARAKLVNRRFLADQARALGLGGYLVISHGEELHGGRDRPSALADAFEALLGALYLDGGFDVVQAFILRHYLEAFEELGSFPRLENPKGELQEMLQAKSPEAPRYHLEKTSGPDHDRVFECAVFHRGAELGRGRGKSKKAAESQAALDALQRIQAGDPDAESFN